MIPPSQAELCLVRACQSGEATAFTALYNAYSPALYSVLVKMVRNQTDPADLLQNVFIRIWTSLHRYNPEQGRLFAWLMAITRNVALDEIRNRKYQAQIKNFLCEQTPESVCSTCNEGMVNQSLFEVLSPKYRQIVELVYTQGWTREEIARELKLPLGTVKTRFRMALLELKQVFGQDIYHYHMV